MKLAVSSKLVITVTLLTAFAFTTSEAQAAARRGLPPGLIQPAKSIEEVARMVMPTVDVAAYVAEDAIRAQSGKPTPLRFAASLDAEITPDNAGSWETLTDSSSLWRLRIASPGALSLNLGLDRFELPTGASLWLYDRNGAMVQGPYTRENRNADGGLWTAVVLGDEIVVELHLPAGMRVSPDLRITSVNHGYREFGEFQSTAATKQGTCNIDVICPEGDGWGDQIRATSRIVISGMFLCSAQLVNNTAEDGTPYMLTAQHCVETASQATSVVALWNYESPTCGLLAGGDLSQTQSGATLVSLWEWRFGSDFTLILLDEMPDPLFNVYYSGWDATGNIPPGSVGIHHPSGDEKAISFNDDPLDKDDYYGSGSHQWRIDQWELGTTEGGSSGSCIYDPISQLCVGTLTTGSASCSNPAGFDIYGRMDVHWTRPHPRRTQPGGHLREPDLARPGRSLRSRCRHLQLEDPDRGDESDEYDPSGSDLLCRKGRVVARVDPLGSVRHPGRRFTRHRRPSGRPQSHNRSALRPGRWRRHARDHPDLQSHVRWWHLWSRDPRHPPQRGHVRHKTDPAHAALGSCSVPHQSGTGSDIGRRHRRSGQDSRS